ncbi:hypothetical protein OH76DRAFT_769797 [Lentinus brumalis]|uniref:Uncharacterized protein n=1 Tax=Lentinus brumalis TaxID=2498619 RepID=A0A371D4Q1_9APHY|nr:hypothetical protein OH76DRAFT_769797 [Polyporus brumalis]
MPCYVNVASPRDVKFRRLVRRRPRCNHLPPTQGTSTVDSPCKHPVKPRPPAGEASPRSGPEAGQLEKTVLTVARRDIAGLRRARVGQSLASTRSIHHPEERRYQRGKCERQLRRAGAAFRLCRGEPSALWPEVAKAALLPVVVGRSIRRDFEARSSNSGSESERANRSLLAWADEVLLNDRRRKLCRGVVKQKKKK